MKGWNPKTDHDWLGCGCPHCQKLREDRGLSSSPRSAGSVPSFAVDADQLLTLIESDFGQSGRDVRVEAIRCELQSAWQTGWKAKAQNDQVDGRAIARPVGRLVVPDSEPTEAPKKS